MTARYRQSLALPAALVTLLVPLSAPARTPTFSREVAPILHARCASCHRPNQIGPMPLLTYAQVRPWAKAIRDEVLARTMPPWRADPKVGSFSNDARLTDSELRTLVAWAEGGAPEGSSRVSAPPPGSESEWNIGAPDLELAMPREFVVPAKGDLDLQYFTVSPVHTEDRWITAAEIRPGARAVVHHATVYVLPPPGGSLPPDPGFGAACDKTTPPPPRTGGMARDYLFSWSPGSPPFVAPKGAGRLLPAGARLLFELHYTPRGEAIADRTRIALRFSPRPAKTRVDTLVAQNRRIVIPPGEPDYRASACVEFARPVTLLELKPHMHLRGRSMRFTLVEPGGKKELLLSVPDYSFDWQLAYRLRTPRAIAAGARIVVDASYDNSARNKLNPDPAQEVHWDEWWRGEMLAGMITFSER